MIIMYVLDLESGPQNADAVFEVLVEGGMTRLINIFYESDTSYHGQLDLQDPDPTVLRPLRWSFSSKRCNRRFNS